MLSTRLHQYLKEESIPKPAQLFTFFYPEFPLRGSQLCIRLAQCLVKDTSNQVLFINLNKSSVLQQSNSKLSLIKILKIGLM